MAKIKQGGIVFEVDNEGNPTIKKVIVQEVVAVPDIQTPETNRVVSITTEFNKIALGLFSKREEVTLTGVWQYLGNVGFKAGDYEDALTSFTATAEYIVEIESSLSRAELKLYSYGDHALIIGSEVDTGVVNKGKIKIDTTELVMPINAIIEIWGRKISGSVSFLSARILITKKRRA